EMRRGETRLADQCRYLVQRSNEVYLAPGEEEPPSNTASVVNQKELLRHRQYVPHRPKKDPRDLRILDPACGSGHFLLYAFDLLLAIYEEAHADTASPRSQATGRTLAEDYPTLDALRNAVPGLILAHNLHGVDIDGSCAWSNLWLAKGREGRRETSLGSPRSAFARL